MRKPLILTPIFGIPLIKEKDDLVELIWQALHENDVILQENDILVITQKIISKAEGRLVNLNDVRPSEKAYEIGAKTQRDSRLVELILRESNHFLRMQPEALIVEHRLGFVCANAGIDHSNVQQRGKSGKDEEWVLLLPKDPDESAQHLRKELEERAKVHLGVLIIDTQGRAWRQGVTGMSIGLSGMPALVDLRGKEDLLNQKLRITIVAASDELAAAASLLMGQADEGIPVVHVRGFPYQLRESSLKELLRPRDKDLFR